ncbi:MAG TPA: hypothetical protein PLI68_11310 [Bacteroidia bacterium]|nr:hypothetical protein [Bacteroidia bacterium]
MEKEFFISNGLLPQDHKTFDDWTKKFIKTVTEKINGSLVNEFEEVKKKTGLTDSSLLIPAGSIGVSYNAETLSLIYDSIGS